MMKLTKNGSTVAKASDCWNSRVTWEDFFPIRIFDLFYLPTVTLASTVVFEHMAGRGLMSFLDETTFELHNGDQIEVVPGLRYVHGRSEVMRGNPSITAVLLAKPLDAEVDRMTWLSFLPQIYTRFLEVYGKQQKSA